MDVKVLGAAMTPFGRHAGADLRSLAVAATTAALGDAGLGPADVGMVVFGNATDGILHGQEMIRGEVALRHAGFRGVPIVNVENACASSSTALHVACLAVEAGAVDVALAVGVEKLTHAVKARSFTAIATAVDLDEDPAVRRMVAGTLLGQSAGDEPVVESSPLMVRYAAKAQQYMTTAGATDDDLARVSVKNRAHAVLNPNAQFRTPITADEVLASRMIADPLRLLMCAPIGDGAAAVVVASPAAARRLGGGRVTVAACALTSNGADPAAARPAERAARAAYDQAGVGPMDVDVAEVHDACSAAELWMYEQLGFCGPGDGPKLLADGATALGGRLPVNTSGGLLSRGHPLGATGCGQLVELVDQLRGRAGDRQVPGARVALAHNAGGMLDRTDEAAAVVTILIAGRPA
ncbi:MAG TPA: thiolase family protein [Acidimicrobiia bacterium]|nr:thiolase family protein [Acidimicrobiia bacterium]